MVQERRSHAQIRKLVEGIEKILNAPIPGTPKISGIRRNAEGNLQGRVMYVALPGSKRKSQNVLSRRAQQVLGQINRTGRTSAAALMEALEVNRNVIAGAVHELKQAGFVGTEAMAFAGGSTQAAAEHAPRKRKTTRK